MLKTDCTNLSGKCDDRFKVYVTKAEFSPVRFVVYALVVATLTQVIRLIVAGRFTQ